MGADDYILGSEKICKFCKGTGKHYCPDTVELILINCTNKECPITNKDKNENNKQSTNSDSSS